MTRNEAIQTISDDLTAALQTHWSDCLKADLDGHSPEAHRAVEKRLAEYFSELQALPEPASTPEIVECLRRLFTRLDEVSASVRGGLLETDERELIVGPTNAAAEVAGLNLADFPSRDPTWLFRNF